jgi:plastocyanin
MRWSVAVRVLAGVALASGLVWFALLRPGRVVSQPAADRHIDHAMMTEAGMKRWADAWWATHKPVGVSSNQGVTVTFQVTNFRFDLDGNAATQVDTARISVGETVNWTWITGTHTLTSGTGAGDPGAGALFDQPMDTGHRNFSFTFPNPGTFRFFCRPHELDQMKGVIVVSTVTGAPLPEAALGFTLDPAPNPTRDGARFAFSLRVPGHARAEVFDARGRRVAVALEGDLPSGPHGGEWDGRVTGGARAAAGLYYLRLTLPGYSASRAIAVTK